MTTKQTNRRALLTGAALAATAAGITSGISKAADAPAQKKVYRTGPKPATLSGLFHRHFARQPAVPVRCHLPDTRRCQSPHRVLRSVKLRSSSKRPDRPWRKAYSTFVLSADIKDLKRFQRSLRRKIRRRSTDAQGTIAAAAIPANSLVEIDVIAYIWCYPTAPRQSIRAPSPATLIPVCDHGRLVV